MISDKNAKEQEIPMSRIAVPAADAIIGVRRPVLDHGFVTLVDYMGNDDAIVQAARVSYGAGTKTLRDDKGLIRYLLRHHHTTPFEMVEAKFLAKMPIFVARQWVRHRTASLNEYSERYSLAIKEYYVPPLEAIQAQSTSNRQGREEKGWSIETKERMRNEIIAHSDASYALYNGLVERGLARELARTVLPVNFYTEWYWKIDLHNLMHFLSLRLDAHAQWEIRQYAVTMADMTKVIVPVAYEAFEDFALNSAMLSNKDQAAVAALLRGSTVEEACASAGLELRKADGEQIKSGEGPEFLQKLEIIKARLGATGRI